MSDLFPILWVIVMVVIFSNLGKKSKKAGTQQAKQPQQVKPQQAAGPVAPQRKAPAQVQQGKTSSTPTGGEMKPRVATSVEVSRHDHSGMFAGSMEADTHEGEDPCHDGELGEVRMPSTYSDRIINRSLDEGEEQQILQPAIDLDWEDSKGLVKAFVMQEVLKRPCDRRR